MVGATEGVGEFVAGRFRGLLEHAERRGFLGEWEALGWWALQEWAAARCGMDALWAGSVPAVPQDKPLRPHTAVAAGKC
jgi:hypothetical protein